MKNQRGQVIVLFLLLLPFISAALLYLVNLSHVVFEKMRLQGVVDRAVYAGASHLSYRLNEITNLNRQVNKLMEDLRREYGSGMRSSEEEGRKHFQDMQRKQGDLYQEMQNINNEGYMAACDIAAAVVQQSEGAVFLPLNSVSDDCAKGKQMGGIYPDEQMRLLFHEMVGIDFDPTRAGKKYDEDAIPQFFKDPVDLVNFGGMVVKEIPQFIGSPKRLVVLAAARPTGGEITVYDSIYEPVLVKVAELPPEEIEFSKQNCEGGFCDVWEDVDVTTIQH